MSKPKITFRCPVFDFSGYATISRNIVLELYKTDEYDIVIEPLRWVNSGNIPMDPEDHKILVDLEKRHIEPGYKDDIKNRTLVHMSIATEYTFPHGFKKAFGLTMLETDKIPPVWIDKCNQMDGMIVPSYFNLSSFTKSGVTSPIRAVPFGVDFDMYNLDRKPLLSAEDLPTKFNFLLVGQWGHLDRKNIRETITRFLSTFRGNTEVGLIAKIYNTGAGTLDRMQIEETIQVLRNQLNMKEDEGPQIHLVHGALTAEEMSALYHNADVFILPSLGEAWGMPIIEAVASGIPVITTGGTGAETYLNPDLSIMLNYKWQPIPQSLWWQGVYEPQQEITMPDWDEFERMLKRVVTLSDVTKVNALKQREELITRDFTWKNCAQTLVNTLRELGGI